MEGAVISIFILQTVLCTIAGLSLNPSSDLTLESFSVVCEFGGAAWTGTLLFSSDGRSAGGCGSPPNPVCGSSLGNITTQNAQNVILTLDPSNILTYGTALWQCTHTGLPPGEYNATVIAVCSDGEVKQNNEKIDVKCSCGFPSVKATLRYKISGIEDEEPKVVDLQNSTGNCVDDSRAADYSYSVEDIPVGAEELCVSFTTLSQISAAKEICAPIGCRDPFWFGFLPVFLIVLISSIICLIILKLEPFEKMGGLTKEKIAFIIASIIVTIAVGLGLGFGLRSGHNKCEKWILAICLSFLFGVVISIVICVFIVIRNSKKGSKDEGVTSDKKTDTERSDGDKRARSPVSASAVKVQAEKSSHNKPTEKSTGASSLQTKSYGSPLPEIPTRKQDSGEMESSHEKTHIKSHGSRNNQLEPLNADSVEGESYVPEKKKKKKKKKKREDSRENEEEN